MKTRSIISILLVFAMVFMAAACGMAGATGNDESSNTDSGLNGNTNSNPDASTGEDGSTDNNPDANTGKDSEDSEEAGSSSSNNDSNLTGSAEDVLNSILDALNNAGVNMPMALPPLSVASDLSQNTIGLSQADFERLVVTAYSSQAAIATFAHQIIMIQAKDAAAAAEIKNLVTGTNGYDAMKWICVIPESALAVEAGEYVMIVASRNEVVDAVLEAFTAAAGNTGEADKFFEHIDDGTGDVIGGGMAPMLPIGRDD